MTTREQDQLAHEADLAAEELAAFNAACQAEEAALEAKEEAKYPARMEAEASDLAKYHARLRAEEASKGENRLARRQSTEPSK